jgi:exportin-1
MQWDAIIDEISRNVEVLNRTETIKSLGHVLKVNVAACSSIGSGYQVQLARNYVALLRLYECVSGMVSESVVRDGSNDFMYAFRVHISSNTAIIN